MEKLGICLTVAWALLSAFLLYTRWEHALGMSLNEWGDFLAGMTAPVAFLWLIIGYMLQRKELSLNTEALLLTKNEMSAQTELLKKQAMLAEHQSSEIWSKNAMDALGNIFKNKQ
ncbi:hypothetical protein ACRTC7_22445 [Vibrio fluvialis]|uniref:hypothetical protein n=1 Tax=Vibrio fluvialis TaxID=676 RepID=UPI001C9CB650|nr:hypothetical protein [Vibrio fluvialis]MBY8105100.1 hypothetical protein [Vibrio fluvialis]